MNKQVKKKLELQLQSAIEGILLKQDSGAAEKSRKTIRQASKAVVKKFNKSVKSLEEKKDSEKKKKIKSKVKLPSNRSQLKNISGENASVKRTYTRTPAPPPVDSPETVPAESPRTENL